MIMLSLFSWWYGPGWAGVITSTKRRFDQLGDMFSITILLRTLFAPWRRIVTNPGAGIEAKMHALGDNLVSRCIGFTVRIFVLLAATVAFLLLAVAALLEIILWPLVPLVSIGLIVRGLV
jgi:hypothetical protein